MKSTLFHRTSLNSTYFTHIRRISLWISLWISFADFIMNFISDFTILDFLFAGWTGYTHKDKCYSNYINDKLAKIPTNP